MKYCWGVDVVENGARSFESLTVAESKAQTRGDQCVWKRTSDVKEQQMENKNMWKLVGILRLASIRKSGSCLNVKGVKKGIVQQGIQCCLETRWMWNISDRQAANGLALKEPVLVQVLGGCWACDEAACPLHNGVGNVLSSRRLDEINGWQINRSGNGPKTWEENSRTKP